MLFLAHLFVPAKAENQCEKARSNWIHLITDICSNANFHLLQVLLFILQAPPLVIWHRITRLLKQHPWPVQGGMLLITIVNKKNLCLTRHLLGLWYVVCDKSCRLFLGISRSAVVSFRNTEVFALVTEVICIQLFLIMPIFSDSRLSTPIRLCFAWCNWRNVKMNWRGGGGKELSNG